MSKQHELVLKPRDLNKLYVRASLNQAFNSNVKIEKLVSREIHEYCHKKVRKHLSNFSYLAFSADTILFMSFIIVGFINDFYFRALKSLTCVFPTFSSKSSVSLIASLKYCLKLAFNFCRAILTNPLTFFVVLTPILIIAIKGPFQFYEEKKQKEFKEDFYDQVKQEIKNNDFSYLDQLKGLKSLKDLVNKEQSGLSYLYINFSLFLEYSNELLQRTDLINRINSDNQNILQHFKSIIDNSYNPEIIATCDTRLKEKAGKRSIFNSPISYCFESTEDFIERNKDKRTRRLQKVIIENQKDFKRN